MDSSNGNAPCVEVSANVGMEYFFRVVDLARFIKPPNPGVTHQYVDPADGTICGGLFVSENMFFRGQLPASFFLGWMDFFIQIAFKLS